MIVVVVGEAPWAKVCRTLDYFHARDRYTGVISENGAARRWALERGLTVVEEPLARAIDNPRRPRMHAFAGAASMVDMARTRGRKVIETI